MYSLTAYQREFQPVFKGNGGKPPIQHVSMQKVPDDKSLEEKINSSANMIIKKIDKLPEFGKFDRETVVFFHEDMIIELAINSPEVIKKDNQRSRKLTCTIYEPFYKPADGKADTTRILAIDDNVGIKRYTKSNEFKADINNFINDPGN